ncbi:hypothetical protein GLAREA_12963 [Glarea lozoyensis ATCC 20868]|uniref:Uncharacterized protein n=1 Tax=Glarea lozoyensis (strain ATCC 20868 / MF5171) TaxID=1116229 RepID=S3CXA3_GLAL2|nr:uncharacterized protein GLAREA_12963 [Glarea lozoyensis ATCC 20868]EPE30240.1 hypothetical protein GLAREA_12963 [Glarea lozoyensis ATCC 20868]
MSMVKRIKEAQSYLGDMPCNILIVALWKEWLAVHRQAFLLGNGLVVPDNKKDAARSSQGKRALPVVLASSRTRRYEALDANNKYSKASEVRGMSPLGNSVAKRAQSRQPSLEEAYRHTE